MTETTITQTAPILADQAHYLIATAGRAPSVHNTQPWRFRVSETAVELYCDPQRRLQADPAGREMLISCGAALFGLRLAVRSLGYQPVVELLPDPARLRLLARVSLGAATPMTAAGREMFRALPHRHTHRGAFGPGPLPAGLVAGLQHDALAEGATLAIVAPGLAYGRLSDIASAVGVPAHAFPATSRAARLRPRGRLPGRDFDLGRGFGLLDPEGPPPAVTAVLLTPGDNRADWLRAGQGLHRLLLHAASKWVFASLHTELLESTLIRALVRDRLALPGAPQMLLQLGAVDTTHPTGRRPPDDLIEP